MAAVDWITIEGFKSIRRITRLPLSPISVLIGPNGSGKSNFIGLFSLLREIRDGRLQEYVAKSGGADRMLHFGSKSTAELKAHVSLGGGAYEYAVTLAPTAGDGLSPTRETCVGHRGGPLESAALGRRKEAWISHRDPYHLDDESVQIVRKYLDGWRVYHFHDTGDTSPLKRTADVNDNRFLRHDGANIAAFLHLLLHRHASVYDLIRRTVQLVAPFFDDFRLEPLALNENAVQLEWRHRASEAYFDASSLSDGTLRFIALATLLLQPPSLRPSVILLDEPELGLHPYAVAILAALVKQASADTQIVISTQSSLLLDEFRPEDVLVADRVDGATELRRLDAGRLATWLENYSLGQLWKKNELGGRPTRETAPRSSAP